ncbi:unnamed protein product [Protopolystoma xenopodis]|uniref:Dynein heavy chain region D6 P-loop domain-containing protein n=1 Tax=Protopolystoma xenopodis TaxID=117903 RepID=A0A3S5BRT0_9PLAT|nr:unnamed protein product [Protopolystoma xenopodis]
MVHPQTFRLYLASITFHVSLPLGHPWGSTIEKSPRSDMLEQRIDILLSETTRAAYNNVARGLFESDKLVFSFLLCVQILRQAGQIDSASWSYLLTGAAGADRQRPEQPASTRAWLLPRQWRQLVDLAYNVPEPFKTLPDDIQRAHVWITIETKISTSTSISLASDSVSRSAAASSPSTTDEEDHPDASVPIATVCAVETGSDEVTNTVFRLDLTPEGLYTQDEPNWDAKLTGFQKLLVVASVCEERLVQAVTEFVRSSLGQQFTEPPSTDLSLLYEDMNNVTPLIFVLSTGSDPMSQFQRFAKEMNYSDRVQAVSLGQGQGPMAEKLMEVAVRSGDWIFLQVGLTFCSIHVLLFDSPAYNLALTSIFRRLSLLVTMLV